jgi:hypothetical protein
MLIVFLRIIGVLEHFAADYFVVRIQANLDHIVDGAFAPFEVSTGAIKSLQSCIRFSSVPGKIDDSIIGETNN